MGWPMRIMREWAMIATHSKRRTAPKAHALRHPTKSAPVDNGHPIVSCLIYVRREEPLSSQMPAESEEPELVRWRPWPCENCRGGAPLIDYLLGRHEAGGEIPGGSEDEIIDELIRRERAWVVEWVESCEHTAERAETLTRLDEGSEHIVYLPPGGKTVVKLTKPGLYGDSYC